MLESVASRVRGRRILDIGVGTGRTIPIMQALSEDYVAIDFLPPMVEACRRRYPGARVLLGDARDMAMFGAGSFDVVMFSYNGIDAVDHVDRQRVLREVHRVLVPGGLFLFSTFNEAGPCSHEKPWRHRLTLRDVAHPRRVVRTVCGFPLDVRNYTRHHGREVIGEGWAIRNVSAHHFALVTHFTTLEWELSELLSAGFEAEETRDSRTGSVIDPSADVSKVWWFHISAHTFDVGRADGTRAGADGGARR
jgi:SAM-dependent methyltransferase